jgi:hypothetical protein
LRKIEKIEGEGERKRERKGKGREGGRKRKREKGMEFMPIRVYLCVDVYVYAHRYTRVGYVHLFI